MKPQARQLFVLMAVFAILGLSFLRRDDAVPMSAAAYTGTASIPGQVQLDLSVSPPVGAPRDTLQLLVRLSNHTSSFASPQVQIQLPVTLRADSGQMPTGVTSNIGRNSLQWLPVVPPGGGVRELSMPLKVSSADLTHPEQQISVQLKTAEGEFAASTVVWIGVPPRVDGLTNPSHVSVGQPLSLSAQIQGPGPFAETWDLGDGRRVAVNTPTVVYPMSGVYDVTVTVKNPLGATTYTSAITVVPHVSAMFTSEDDTPGIEQEVIFTNAGGGQQPVQYKWDFGDGSTSTESQPSHAFDSPGTYNVTLLAENAFGNAEYSQIVTVGLPPEADIIVAGSAPAGSQLAGEALIASSDVGGTEYSWEMGDGRHYKSAKINHAYRQTGDYFVTLTASNEFGETQVGQWVHIEDGILHAYLPMISYSGGMAQGSSVDTSPQFMNTSELDVAVDAPFVMDPLQFSGLTRPVEQLLAYINEARRQFGLSKLGVSSDLSTAAQKHTNDMAEAEHNLHTGSDGSKPSDRFLQFGYESGYAGEATAWGFADPRQAVEFWVNSPGHRPIILNRYASEVGLGYTVDYTAPSVWYWTAEFGNASALPDAPILRVQGPATGLEVLNSEEIAFFWNWPTPLAPAEQFTVYLLGSSGPIAIGSVTQPTVGTQYRLFFTPADVPELLGEFQWQVRLENNRGAELTSGELRALTIHLDPDLPTPTPLPTLAPVIPTAAPAVLPTITPTPTATTQAPAPRPTDLPLPPFVTATPLPVEP